VRDLLVVLAILGACGLAGIGLWSYQNERISLMMGRVAVASVDGSISEEEKRLLELERDLLKIELDARAPFVQLGLAAGVLVGLYFTYRNFGVAQRNLELAQKNLDVATQTLLTTQKGQVTERFTRLDFRHSGG
jgi:hypothetical protein